MSGGSTEARNANTFRPSATSANNNKSNIINHFQQSLAPIKKSSSFNNNRCANQSSNNISDNKTSSYSQTFKNSDSRSTVRNHVQFVLPLSDGNRSNTPSKSDINFFSPTNSNSSIGPRFTSSEFKHFDKPNENPIQAKSMANGLNRLSNTAPLKNLTSIRSSSFRNKHSMPNSTKYEPSKPFVNSQSANVNLTNNIANNSDFMSKKSRSCKSYESINLLKDSEGKFEDSSKSIDPNTHTIHRLIKMATNWNSKNKHKSDPVSGLSAKPSYVMSDRSLISQTKIRKTQTFLSDENKIDSESSLSRKMAEVSDIKSNKVNNPSIDDAFTDNMSDKSGRIYNNSSRRTPQPKIRILPMNLNRLADMSKNTNHSNEKKSVHSLETNDFSKNNQYWSNSVNQSEIGDLGMGMGMKMGSSAKESSISSYLSKKTKSISFMHLNKNLGSSFKTNSTSTQGLNRVTHGVPIQIQ